MITAYLSHMIRGIEGHSSFGANCEEAIIMANILRQQIPNLEIYVPAEHDEFVSIAYHDGILTEKQILDIDCKILDKRNFVIVFTHGTKKLSNGMETEVNYADAVGMQVFYIDSIDANKILDIKSYVEFLNEKCK